MFHVKQLGKKVLLLHVSLNPEYYNLERLSQYTFDQALEFFENDEVCCKTYGVEEIDLSQPNEFAFHADGVAIGDGSDTMLNWLKVV